MVALAKKRQHGIVGPQCPLRGADVGDILHCDINAGSLLAKQINQVAMDVARDGLMDYYKFLERLARISTTKANFRNMASSLKGLSATQRYVFDFHMTGDQAIVLMNKFPKLVDFIYNFAVEFGTKRKLQFLDVLARNLRDASRLAHKYDPIESDVQAFRVHCNHAYNISRAMGMKHSYAFIR